MKKNASINDLLKVMASADRLAVGPTGYGYQVMKIIKPFIFCAFALIISGCSRDAFNDDRDIHLPGGYKVISTSSDDIEIAMFHGELKILVPEKVVGAGWNSNFIAAEQQLLKNRGAFSGDTFQIPDPGHFKYWIIDIKKTNSIGPMTEVEYHKKLDSLGQRPIQIQAIKDLK